MGYYNIIKILSLLFLLLLSVDSLAQENAEVMVKKQLTKNHTSIKKEHQQEIQMADVMRSNGKIYVVLVIILIIFAGIIYYMVRIDLKLKKLEQKQSIN